MTDITLKTAPLNRAVVVHAYTCTFTDAPDYLAGTFAQRASLTDDGQLNSLAAGSVYADMSPQMLANAIIDPTRDWVEVIGHPAIAAQTRVFRTNLSGLAGMVELATLAPETPILLTSPAKGGNLFPLVEWDVGDTIAPYTYVVIGMKNPSRPFFVTFYPGELIPRSELNPGAIPPYQRRKTAAEAMALDFTHAKAVAAFPA